MLPADDQATSEWQTRLELAACYRLVAHLGLEDLTYNHISARVPGERALLVKPLDYLFREVTASSLLKFGLDGTPLDGNSRKAPNAIQVLHAEVMLARSDVGCVIHTHSVANAAVSIQKSGLIPFSQHALTLYGKVVAHDFSGYEFDLAMAAPLIRDLANHSVVTLRNHGALVVDRSIGEAYVTHHFYEMACRIQIAALAGGAEIVIPDEAIQAHAARQVQAIQNVSRSAKDWPACLRLANELYGNYRN